jgi:hypothetical protein
MSLIPSLIDNLVLTLQVIMLIRTGGRHYMFSHFFRFSPFFYMHLILLAQLSTSFSIPVPRISVLYHNFIEYFLVISRQISLVSGD